MTRSLVVTLVATAVVGILATMGGVRWAKRQTRGAQFVASGMMLVLGMVGPMVVKPPEQGVVEANEDKGKTRIGVGGSAGRLRVEFVSPSKRAWSSNHQKLARWLGLMRRCAVRTYQST